ncbi:MAG: septation protein A [Gammaproteobacteria bacterium]|nr:septation protein A [Gammaproteobacteria bacterium]
MKFLFDFFPILLFFAAYKIYGIYAATATAIAATFLQVGLYWLKNRSFEKSHLITLTIIVIFGGATLYLHDPLFIKWKPTVAYWLFAITFIGSQFIGEKPLIKRMMGHAISVPDIIWTRLNITWALFFIAMGLVNLYVAYNYDEDTWVNFKLFGLMGITLLFVLAQGLYLSRYMEDEDEDDENEKEKIKEES